MRDYKKWTEEDIMLLRKEIEKSPHNLTTAFRVIAKKRNASFASVRQQYYKYRNTRYSGVFTLISKKKVVTDGKNIAKEKIHSTNKVNIISDVISYIKSFFKL